MTLEFVYRSLTSLRKSGHRFRTSIWFATHDCKSARYRRNRQVPVVARTVAFRGSSAQLSYHSKSREFNPRDRPLFRLPPTIAPTPKKPRLVRKLTLTQNLKAKSAHLGNSSQNCKHISPQRWIAAIMRSRTLQPLSVPCVQW